MKNGLSGVSDCWRADPDDRLVGDVGADVIIRIAGRRDAGHAIVQRRGVEVGLALKKPVELVEARVCRPAVHRPGDTQFPRRQLVGFAEHRGTVAVQPQDFGQRCDGLGTHAVHAGKRRAHLGHAAHVRAVRVAAGEQGHPRRRADRRGVHVGVAQAAFGEALEGRHVDRPAKASRVAEPEIVHQDEDDVGCARPFGWLQLEARRRRGLACIDFGDRRMLWLGQRQHGSIRLSRSIFWFLRHRIVPFSLVTPALSSGQIREQACSRRPITSSAA